MYVFSPLFKEDDIRKMKMREKENGNFLLNDVRKKKDKIHLEG